MRLIRYPPVVRCSRWWLVLGFVFGCDGGASAPDAGGADGAYSDATLGDEDGGRSVEDGGAPRVDAGTPFADGGVLPPGSCYDGTVELSTVDGVTTARTPRYEVEAQASPERAERFARMLEAAYAPFTEYFGADPAPAERLRVRFFRDQPAFVAGLAEDSITGVEEAGGYYAPSNRTAYLHDQPTRYYTRVLLLHEAAHQLHALTRTVGRLPFWFGEGVVEYLARHDWDERCIRLGVQPLLTQEDTPARALTELEAGGLSVDEILGGTTVPSRAAAQSLFRYFEETNAPAFGAFRAAVDSGTDPAAAFAASVGSGSEHDGPWLSFLQGDQEPLRVVYLEWTHISSTSVAGDSPGVFSIARTRSPVAHFELGFTVPTAGGWSAGVLLGYESNERWQALVVRDTGALARFDVDGRAVWNSVGVAPAARDERYELSVDYEGARVTVSINGEAFTYDTELPHVSGPAIDSSRVVFDGIAWR